MKRNDRTHLWLALVGALACIVALSGCAKTEPPRFRENVVLVTDLHIPIEQRQVVVDVLEAMYGTPDHPYVLPETGLNLKRLKIVAGPVRTDALGRDEGLFRRHCGHCHGTSGDGMGPTAALLNPYPRDYRQGKFKFKSTERAAKPTDDDLRMILQNGVPGTAMPAFILLPDDQLDALVEYVKYLSMRGETEERLLRACADLSEGDKLSTERSYLVDEVLSSVAEPWKAARKNIIAPPEKPAELAASIAAGRELFYGNKANCVKCHGVTALGDGQTTDYDDWSKAVVDATKSLEGEREATLKSEEGPGDTESGAPPPDTKQTELKRIARQIEILKADTLPPRNAQPRNLRLGVYRGGLRPLDLYRRLHAGINGSPMPGVGPSALGAQGTLTTEEIWNLVDYVRSLPYEPLSEPPRQPATPGRPRL